MKLYIDKKNLISLMKSKDQPVFSDCSNLIRKNFDVLYNFPKDELKTDSLLMAWFSSFGQGVKGRQEFANKEEDVYPTRPLKSNFYSSGDLELLSSVFLLDDAHICEVIKNKACILIGSTGDELNVISSLIIEDTEIQAVKIPSWSQYLPSLPLTDIIISDNHYFKSKEVYVSNNNELLRYLCSIPQNSPVNVVIITKKGEVDRNIDLNEEIKNIKDLVKDATDSKKSTATILTTYRSHDRALITNYYRVKNGSSFHLKNSGLKSDVLTEIKSHGILSNEIISKQLLKGIFQEIANNPADCYGDRISHFLNF
jgi:hypothetical protein